MSERQWNGSPEFPIDNRPDAPPLPPPQEPTDRSRRQDYFRVPDCTCGHKRKERAEEQPYECMVGDEEKHCGCEGFVPRPAALAGETRTEAIQKLEQEWIGQQKILDYRNWLTDQLLNSRASISALMEAIEPYVTHGDLTSGSHW